MLLYEGYEPVGTGVHTYPEAFIVIDRLAKESIVPFTAIMSIPSSSQPLPPVSLIKKVPELSLVCVTVPAEVPVLGAMCNAFKPCPGFWFVLKKL
ncbi:hypothetical protein [Methanobacterium congolense]|uniref:hypothetical protein n=1 Tax=Methanobacterium congolense TaxID=118062 RepID=UPI001495BC83|nr:hypothetical protein [Methanobacterium congolense]